MRRNSLMLLLLACSGISACSWLVDPENQPIRCALGGDTGIDPCGAGFVCARGACTPKCVLTEGEPDPCGSGLECRDSLCLSPCKANRTGEICADGIDNDCDGLIDEPDPEGKEACGDKADNDCDMKIDEGHDQDGDRNDWCGDPTKPGGGGIGDCDDRNPAVYYMAPELCDGIDNDCDNVTDETAGTKSLCPADQECVGQQCVVPNCAIPDSSAACSDRQMCDVETGRCVPKGCSEATCNGPSEYCDQVSGECRTERRKNGESCAAHSDCKSLSCIESAALRLTVAAARVCGQTCCEDSECGTGERCFTAGTGARSCLPIADVPVPDGQRAFCTLDQQCGGNDVCSVELRQRIEGSIVDTRDNLTTAVCRTPASWELEIGDTCRPGEPPRCESNACMTANQFFGNSLCSQSCGASSDCAALAAAARADSYCQFVAISMSSPAAYVPVCVVAGFEVGSGKPGTECTNARACQEGGCVGATVETKGRCAATCCSDSQCGNWGAVPTLCRPVAFGTGHYETRCVP